MTRTAMSRKLRNHAETQARGINERCGCKENAYAHSNSRHNQKASDNRDCVFQERNDEVRNL
jgi:hypothetical protein